MHMMKVSSTLVRWLRTNTDTRVPPKEVAAPAFNAHDNCEVHAGCDGSALLLSMYTMIVSSTLGVMALHP